MRGFFVTGTDTGVGKTFVGCALLAAARARGLRCLGYKPIETGCARGDDGALVGDDGEALSRAAGDWQRGAQRGGYRFELPAAPAEAARRVGAEIDLGLALAPVRAFTGDLALVEGAGGWRVPITVRDDTAALARAAGLPVLVVARGGLGTINHTALTVQAIQRDGLAVAAVVLSVLGPDELVASNATWIADLTGARVVRTDQPDWTSALLT